MKLLLPLGALALLGAADIFATGSKAFYSKNGKGGSPVQNLPQAEVKRSAGPASTTLERNLWNQEWQAGLEAYKLRDYSTAASLFKQMEDISHHSIFPIAVPAMPLARIYVKQGLQREAYEQLRYVVYPQPNSYSSDQDNPRVLTYFGDLCAKFGYHEEADRSYVAACHGAAKVGHPEPFKQLFLSVNMDTPERELRSSALAASSLTPRSEAKDKLQAVHEAEAAVALAPSSVLARLAYAHVIVLDGNFDYEKAKPQAWKAEQLADADQVASIEEFRRQLRLLYASFSIEFNPATGQRSQHIVAYRPKEPVPTPKIAEGFALALPEE